MPFDMSNRTTRSSQKRQSQGLVYIVGDHHNKDIHKTRICKETNEQNQQKKNKNDRAANVTRRK